MKNGLKMKFEKEKEKKENSAGFPFSPDGPSGPSSLPAPAHLSPSLFLFHRDADIRGPPVSLPFPLSFLLPLATQPSRRRRAIPAAPGRLPTFLSSPRSQLRQSNPS
jgi:hypothetical protein